MYCVYFDLVWIWQITQKKTVCAPSAVQMFHVICIIDLVNNDKYPHADSSFFMSYVVLYILFEKSIKSQWKEGKNRQKEHCKHTSSTWSMVTSSWSEDASQQQARKACREECEWRPRPQAYSKRCTETVQGWQGQCSEVAKSKLRSQSNPAFVAALITHQADRESRCSTQRVDRESTCSTQTLTLWSQPKSDWAEASLIGTLLTRAGFYWMYLKGICDRTFTLQEMFAMDWH